MVTLKLIHYRNGKKENDQNSVFWSFPDLMSFKSMSRVAAFEVFLDFVHKDGVDGFLYLG